MAVSKNEWKSRKEPAYDYGESSSYNLKYKYSESDCSDMPEAKYKLNDVELIDFWGEGYIEDKSINVTTGFKNAYNINHQYQLVSNGPNKDRKIPNRIPVASYKGYNLKPYINDSSARYVTLMGAPLTEETYREIMRILRKNDGVYIFFSSDSEVELLSEKKNADLIFAESRFCFLDKNVYKRIDKGLIYAHISIPIGFVYMSADKILQYIKSETTSFSNKELATIMYNFFCQKLIEHWKEAIDYLQSNNIDYLLLSSLEDLCKDKSHYDCVTQFLNYLETKMNIFFYMQEVSGKSAKYPHLYKFFEQWDSNMLRTLFVGKYASIKNLEFERYLKLPKSMLDKDDDKPAYGGSKKRGIEAGEEERFWWRITPVIITKKETIVNIFNVKFDMPLKLPKKMVDKDNDKPVYGGCAKRKIESDSETRFYWRLEKVKYSGKNFYTLTNVAYNMPLKLPVAMVDKDDDKPAYGGSAERKIERNQERRFYWYIQAVGDYVLQR